MIDPNAPQPGSIDWLVQQKVDTQLSEEEAVEIFEEGIKAYEAAKQSTVTRTSVLMTPLAYWLL